MTISCLAPASTEATQRRLFIVGNDAFMLHAMRFARRYPSGLDLFGVIDRRANVRQVVREAQPDVIVVDGLADTEVDRQQLQEICDEAPSAEILVLTAPGAIETAAPVAQREPCPLSRRELEVLRAVAEGHTNAAIARQLWVTEQTVKFHLTNIYRKLGVSNRTEASRYGMVNEWVT